MLRTPAILVICTINKLSLIMIFVYYIIRTNHPVETGEILTN